MLLLGIVQLSIPTNYNDNTHLAGAVPSQVQRQ